MSAVTSRSRGFRERLIISFALLILSISLFVLVFFPNRLERQAMRTVIAKAETIRDLVGLSVAPALLFADEVTADSVLITAVRDDDVRFLIVRDTSGRVVAARGIEIAAAAAVRDSASGYLTDDRLAYVTSGRVTNSGVFVGSILVGVSLTDLREDVREARITGGIVGLAIFAIGLLIVFAISSRVTKPLTELSSTVEKIAAGDLTLRVAETGDKEVATFAQAFNRMVTSVDGAQQELARINQELEARVARRTAELSATSQMLQSFIDVAPEAIVGTDTKWLVTHWNKAAEHIFGWTAAEVLGKPLPHVPTEEIESFRARQAVVEAGNDIGATEVVRRRKDGSKVHVLFSVAVLRDADRQPMGHIAVATDLTERKLLEDQLRQAQKMEAIGRLSGGVAHDFNNILTVITSSVGILLEGQRTERERFDLEQIAAATARAAALTRQLLTFSRKHVVHLQPVNVSDVVRQTEPMLRRLLRSNITLTTHMHGEGVVTADPVQLEQVIMNLVVNASDAMPDGGTLNISTENVELDETSTRELIDVRPGPYVLMEVRDTGVGMDSATLNRIFEPFFTTKEVGRGTGLGLAIAYAVVTQLGGSIHVTSEVGNGTTFFIYVPRVTAPQKRGRVITPALVEAVVARSNATVLLVEDEDMVRRLVKRTLERFGYKVVEASNGAAGLEAADVHAGKIDVVVTDLMMPGMNGRAFAEKLLAKRPELRVVFMSGYADETVDREGMVDSAHAFLQKPFTGAQLAKAIQDLIEVRA